MTVKLSKFSLFLALGLLLSVFMVACSGDSGSEKSDDTAEANEDVEQVFNLINSDTIPTMDSSMATDEYAFQFLNASMEGLYRLGENAELQPGIAKDHTVSEDGLTWTFNLRDDALWSNGEPVTANDFVYAWRRAVDPKTGSEYGPYMMGGVIKNATKVNKGKEPLDKLGVKADGDYTLVVTLEKPTPYFESLAAFVTFLPLNEKFVEEQGDKYATSTETLLFNGPFTLSDWKSTSSSWNLKKNEKYWDGETVQLEKITYDVVKDPQTAVDLYEKGEIDRAGLSADLVDKYSSDKDFKIVPGTGVFYLKFNQTESEALANANIRRALSRAINKQALVDEILNNGSVVSNAMIPKDFSSHPETGEDFRDINGDLVTFDVEAAQEFWEKGLKEIGKDKVELEFLGGDGETVKTMNEFIANQLESNLPGLEVTLKQVPFEQRLELDVKMDYQIQFAGWLPDFIDPYTFLNLWLTDGGNNLMGYSNPEYDKLVQSTVNELALEPVKRYEAFLEAEKVLYEDAAIAPLYQDAGAVLTSPNLKGLIRNPMGAPTEYKWAYVGSEE